MKKGLYSTIVLLALTAAASGMQAQSPPGSSRILVPPEKAPRPGGLDRQFALQAAEAGAMEVTLARLAAGQAANEKVKGFAQKMIEDHTQANQELERLAATKHIPLPRSTPPARLPAGTGARVKGSMPPSGQGKDDVMSRLSQLSGEDFDREYMRQAMTDHDQAVALFEHQADAGKDRDLKAWAARMLPTLRHHQSMARDVAAAIGAVLK